MKTPQELGLPFDDWRPGQRLAIRTVLHAKTPIVAIQSPTGTGKSTIATGVMRMSERRAYILTATKGLEDQYERVFPFLFDIRGMSNYRCLAARTEFERLFQHTKGFIDCSSGPCRSGYTCTLKENGCTYFDAVRQAMAATYGMTNYSYWLAMRRFGRGLGAVETLLCDEAHALPEELMAANQIAIPLSLLAADVRMPRTHTRWAQWAAKKIDELKPQGDLPLDKKAKQQKLVDDLERLAGIDETWSWDVHPHAVIFEPTIPRLLLKSLATPTTVSKLVLLSATMTPATLRLLGIPDSDVTFKAMQSTFAAARRPVYVVKTVRVDHRMTDAHTDFWLARIDKIIKSRLDRKGIIHTISYARAQQLLKSSKFSGIMFAPAGGWDTAACVERFRKAKGPAILVSPSVGTGWDFPYTDCEYQIILKMPFPDTRSAIARARIKATEGYREHLTMQAVEQMAGRGMRAADDACETFIIDDHAQWFLPMAMKSGLCSNSFREAVTFTKQVPPPLRKLT